MSKDSKSLGKIVRFDQARIQDHLGELVRGSEEQTLINMLDTVADAFCDAQH